MIKSSSTSSSTSGVHPEHVEGSVMVIGCGALGNEVLKNLVLMGVGHLVIVDFDYVEQGNLTRSILFRRKDVGRPKVEVAKEALLAIQPTLNSSGERVESTHHPTPEITTIFGDVAYDVGLRLVRRMDVIIGCVDSRWARYQIQRLCHRAGKTWVDGGILDLTGTVKVFRPGISCYACSLSSEALADMQRRMPCSGVIRRREAAGHAPTTPLIASIIGAVQAQEALKVTGDRCLALAGTSDTNTQHPTSRTHHLTRMFCYDGDTLTVQTPILEAWDDDCPLHGEWQDTDTMKLVEIDQNAAIGLWFKMRGQPQHPTPGKLLLNEPFVDYIVHRETDRCYPVMLPAHKVQDYVENHPVLCSHLLSEFYQHEYREIDSSFPYPSLTFRDLGIPKEEILRLKIE